MRRILYRSLLATARTSPLLQLLLLVVSYGCWRDSISSVDTEVSSRVTQLSSARDRSRDITVAYRFLHRAARCRAHQP